MANKKTELSVEQLKGVNGGIILDSNRNPIKCCVENCNNAAEVNINGKYYCNTHKPKLQASL